MFKFLPYIKRDINRMNKKQLLQEARRLKGLTDRRIKSIDKQGLLSHSAELLKNRNIDTISTSLSIRQLEDVIYHYDTFLSSNDSTPLMIIHRDLDIQQKFSKFRQNAESNISKIEHNIGRELTVIDFDKLNYVMENSDKMKALAERLPSETIVELVANVENVEEYIDTLDDLTYVEFERMIKGV